ncbi:hypothetical protein GCM10010124_26540 [Pilimelia terevasa]|uniref:Uncharacterized protein n=1 Tax=Pilimelia terevasa TaxID=53372 RepID=A0A8J3BSL9_9ACTN|nr:hypothetical protein [Pilimelia terevasa]GGK32451.1 hypothetical protein GCM10010124_26540 [Pilimelia terevasa]
MASAVNPFAEVPAARVADGLVEAAAALRTVDDGHRMWAALYVRPGLLLSQDEAAAVAAVDAVAAALGVPAMTGKEHGQWRHAAVREWDGFSTDVKTTVTPPRVCACGATCHHAAPPVVPVVGG